ncbi:phage tail tape measure protein [Enterobacter hormaechei]|uniref:phage tail tape measure protein n=1 Tax=Enterobacter cloacae complex TaxID=354276 RepID=UPI0020733BDA|nr:phage tail tape measure protein [Enterobacter hormaechei]MDS0032791.1 phage tail tape measure protein [Enterobacter hormaechei subsp. xiangfangensis]HCQ7009054.1 phage tail tape measure protein [Enterobacter hormaechei]
MKSLNIRVAFSAIDKLTRPVNAARQSAGGLSESLKKTQSSIKDLDSQSRTFNRLRDSVQKTSRKIDDASRALEGLNQAQREGTQLTDKQKAHMAALAAKLERLNSARTQEMVKLRAASQALRSHGVSLVGSDRTIQSAIRRTEQYNQTLERERRQLAAVTQARARYDQMQQTAGKLRGGGTMAVAGATAAGYVAGRFLSPAVGFDREMSRVQALTRIDKSSADFSALRDQAKKLGAETQFTTTDAASGQAFLAMAGFTPQAIQAALPGVLNMALAGGMDLGESADISSNILSQFRLDPKEMDRVSDVLTGAFTRTNTDLQNIGEAMKYAGTGLSSLGVSVEQTTAMIGVMANVGLRGSIAGTGLQAAFSRLAAPTGRAKTALKELGVDVADATGKMRPAEEVLTDLYKKISKYGDTDKLSFFKDIAGEEASKSLQALVMSAGSGELQKLLEALKNAKGESQKAAKIMADNLDGDLKNLDSAWEGFRIQINDLVDNQLRALTQGLSDVVGNMTQWAKENPKLAQSLLIVGGSVLALTAAIGGTSLAIGLLMGPLAKLQLGFTLLIGGTTGTISAIRTLGTASGPAMASVRGWGPVLTSMLSKLRGISIITPGIRAGLMGAFLAPGAALRSLFKNIGMLALRLTGFTTIWSIITTSISVLGAALSLLLSPIGLIAAAFIAAGLLIWRFWEPIRAFFTGFFSGVMQQLAPFRDAFFPLTLAFSAIAKVVGEVWDWFVKLLSPVESSRESLDKCASAGETFGKVLGGALQLLLLPLTTLMEGIGWVLEKLDLIPSGLEAARLKAESLKKDPVMWEWDPQQKKMVQKGWNWSPVSSGKNNNGNTPPPGAPQPTSPLTGDNGTMRRLQSIDNNTKATADNTKKIGPGDIVFKNLPRALAVRGEWKESQLASTTTAGRLSERPAVVAASLPVKQAELLPVSRSASNIPVATGGFTGEIHVHLHGVDRQDAREIGRIVADQVSAELARRERLNRGSFKDRD